MLLIRDGITLVIPRDETESVFFFRSKDGATGERIPGLILWRRATDSGYVLDVDAPNATIEALERAARDMKDEIARFRAR